MALIQYDCCPYKEGKSGCRNRCAEREDDVRRQGEDTLCQARGKILNRSFLHSPQEEATLPRQ